jgi:hypothetical protein
MKWVLIIVATNILPLQLPREFAAAIPPGTVQWDKIEGFSSRNTCEYAGKWFRVKLHREYKCFHE